MTRPERRKEEKKEAEEAQERLKRVHFLRVTLRHTEGCASFHHAHVTCGEQGARTGRGTGWSSSRGCGVVSYTSWG